MRNKIFKVFMDFDLSSKTKSSKKIDESAWIIGENACTSNIYLLKVEKR